MDIRILVGAMILVLSGCASKTTDLRPISPTPERVVELEQFTCNQISMQLSFLEKKAKRLGAAQNEDAESDRKKAALGWMYAGIPYLFLNGDGENKEQFEKVLGEKEMLEELAVKKDCKFNRVNLHHTYDGDY